MAIKLSNTPISLKLLSTLVIIDTIEANCMESIEKGLGMLPLPKTIVDSILCEFEMQTDKYFKEFVEPNIKYKLPNEY